MRSLIFTTRSGSQYLVTPLGPKGPYLIETDSKAFTAPDNTWIAETVRIGCYGSLVARVGAEDHSQLVTSSITDVFALDGSDYTSAEAHELDKGTSAGGW